jgi:hypothetical protein
MKGENGYPETPDWSLASRCPDGCDESTVTLSAEQWANMKAHAECPAHVSKPLTWDGDDS